VVVETVFLIDSIVVCVLLVENVGEVEGLKVFKVERNGDLDEEEDGLGERDDVPVRDETVDRVAVPPVSVMTAVLDTDAVPLFVTARHPVALTDADEVIERVDPCDLLDEEEIDGDRLKCDERLPEFELEGERETIEVAEEVRDGIKRDRVDTDEIDADIENELYAEGLFENDAWVLPVDTAVTFEVTLLAREGDGLAVTETDAVLVISALVVVVAEKRDVIELVLIVERDFKAEADFVKIALPVVERDGELVAEGEVVGLVDREGDFEVEIVAEDVIVTLLHDEIEKLTARDGDGSLETLAKEAVAVTLTSPDRVTEMEANGETESELALDSECVTRAENDALLLDVTPENEGVLEDKEVCDEEGEAETDGVGVREFFAVRVKMENVGTAV
jgi:hypothetical protein